LRALVNMVMTFGFHKILRKFLSSWATGGFSRRIQLHVELISYTQPEAFIATTYREVFSGAQPFNVQLVFHFSWTVSVSIKGWLAKIRTGHISEYESEICRLSQLARW
jgi:hypothetical protein